MIDPMWGWSRQVRERPRVSSWGIEIIACLALALIAAGPGLLPGRTVLPFDVLVGFEPWRSSYPPSRNHVLGDPAMQFSTRIAISEALRGGHLPLWNPHVLSGHPLIGDTLSAPFNPITMALAWALTPLDAFDLQVLLQLWLAGLLMAWWLYELGLSRPARLFGVAVWVLAGYQQVWLAWPFIQATLLWLPGVAAAWERSLRGQGAERRRAIAIGGLAVGMALLGGQVQFALLGALLLCAYGIGRLAMQPQVDRGSATIAAGAIALLGIGVSAIQTLPVLEVLADSARSSFAPEVIRDTGLPWWHLPTFIDPWVLGRPMEFIGAQNINETQLYVGVLPLLLLGLVPFRRKDRSLVLLACLVALVLWVAFAMPGTQLLAWLPGLSKTSLARWLSMWPLLVAPCAAVMIDGIAKIGASRRRMAMVWLALLSALVTAGMVYVWVTIETPSSEFLPRLGLLWIATAVLAVMMISTRRQAAAWLLVAIVAADLIHFGFGYTPSADRDLAFPVSGPLERLVSEREESAFRVAVFQSDPLVLGPSVTASIGLDEIEGYTSSLRGSYARFVRSMSQPADNASLAGNQNAVSLGDASPLLLRMLDVHYILAPRILDPTWREAIPRGGCHAMRSLSAGEVVGRSFVARADGMNALDVELAGGARVALHLTPAPGAEEHLAYGDFDPAESARPILYFAPIAESSGREFYAYADLPTGEVNPAEVCVGPDGELALGVHTTAERYPHAFGSSNIQVHRVPDPLGRAWWVPRAAVVENQDRALDRVVGPGFDPERVVIVESPVQEADWPLENPAAEPMAGLASGDGWAVGDPLDVANLGPNRRRIPLPPDLDRGWLVLSEAWAPGWRARVDGRSAPVLRANGGIQAVPIVRDAQVIELRYLPTSFVVGTAISALALILLGLLVPRARQAIRGTIRTPLHPPCRPAARRQ